MEVRMVDWPENAAERDDLAGRGMARLLVLNGDGPPPAVEDPLEDWIRMPAAHEDLRARVETLSRRVASRSPEPDLDENGVVRRGDSWVALPPVEARITRLLLDRAGRVVSRESLTQAGWPDGAPGRNALDVHMLRLRRRLREVDLGIRTVRSRGYLMELPPRPLGPNDEN